MSRYDPNATPCLPEGEYEAYIVSAVDTVSKSSGNEMVEMTFRVYHGTSQITIKDWFLFSQPWKLKKVAKAVGSLASYETGEFNENDYVGKSLTVVLKVEEQDDFDPQNRVSAYKSLQRQTKATGAEISDDPDVPF